MERRAADQFDAVEQGLRKIRRRRWLLWSIFLTYLPAIWLSLRITGSDRKTAVVFGVWVLLAAVAGGLVAFARCPRCGNYFHMKGLVPVWVRRCLYCRLHLKGESPQDTAG